jgi:hypothetical protein
MTLNHIVRFDSVPFGFPQRTIEKQIHEEFQTAFDELERASGQEKVNATARLNLAVRRLFDFVGYGKLPKDLEFKRPDFR